MHRLTAFAVVGLALSLSACGTTVPPDQRAAGAQSVAGNALDPAQGESPGELGSPGLAPQGAAAATVTRGGAQSRDDARIGMSGPYATGGTAGTAAAQGRGVTATTVTVGAAIPTDTEAVGQAFGIS